MSTASLSMLRFSPSVSNTKHDSSQALKQIVAKLAAFAVRRRIQCVLDQLLHHPDADTAVAVWVHIHCRPRVIISDYETSTYLVPARRPLPPREPNREHSFDIPFTREANTRPSHTSSDPAPVSAPDGHSNLQLHLHDNEPSMPLINCPSPMYMSLLTKLSIAGIVFTCEVAVAYQGERMRVDLCIINHNPYGPAAGPSSPKHDSLDGVNSLALPSGLPQIPRQRFDLIGAQSKASRS
ncbi:hypothetical protein B0H16DRAFT_1733637 [Mycena metata]|uniref:Uncharacterized protein n=1 Tax=Mycena metata TaxID=1033252 RepID=A0AAD7HZG8_9AGAR|nr:hypothetical protein B0H16DRAFT_1733637 [Mycena metata]